MSASSIISPNNNKIYDSYLPNPYPYPAFPSPLGAVLTAGNQAGDQDIIGVDNLQVTKVDNPLLGGSLTIGGAGQDLRIQGATTKGSVLAGNGTSTVGLPVGATGYVLKANPATATGLEWAIDISGVTGVIGVNAGANIDISGTVSQPIVSLQSPLTSTLNMGAVALQDISGVTGTAGQFLSAGAGGQAKWATPAYPVVSVSAGRNIDISGTTTPIISLDNPLTDTLNMGTQSVFYGASTAVRNATSTATETIYQEGGIGGGAQTASYGFSACSVVSGAKQIGIDGNGITNVDGSTGTQLVKNQSSPTQIEIISKNQISTAQTTSTVTSNSVRCDTDNAGGITIQNVMSAGIGTNAESFLTYNDTGTFKANQQSSTTDPNGNVFIQTTIDTNTTDTLTLQLRTLQPALTTQALLQSKLATPVADTTGTINLQTDPTNPLISLGQNAPFATAFSTTWNKDGILQNNSAGTGFNLQTAQDINLIAPIGNFINVSNGNEIKLLDPTSTGFTASFNNMGVDTTFFQAGVASSNADLTNSSGNAQLFLSSTNLATPSAHSLRAEVPLVGNATIEHSTIVGANRDLTISTLGKMNILSGNTGFLLQGSPTGGGNIQGSSTGVISINAGNSATGTIIANAGTASGNANPVLIQSSGAGGASLPMLRLENTNATGSVAIEIYKNKPTAGANGDVLFTQSVYGKDSGNTKQEYTRITSTIRDATAGAEDGSLELGCFVNGGFANFIQLNANDAPIGEVNFTRPLDFIGGSDANSTIKTSGTGSVNLNLDATTSAGAGGIVLKTKNSTGSLSITGDKMTSITSGGNSGHYMVITLPDPTTGLPRVYKIQLLDP